MLAVYSLGAMVWFGSSRKHS